MENLYVKPKNELNIRNPDFSSKTIENLRIINKYTLKYKFMARIQFIYILIYLGCCFSLPIGVMLYIYPLASLGPLGLYLLTSLFFICPPYYHEIIFDLKSKIIIIKCYRLFCCCCPCNKSIYIDQINSIIIKSRTQNFDVDFKLNNGKTIKGIKLQDDENDKEKEALNELFRTCCPDIGIRQEYY